MGREPESGAFVHDALWIIPHPCHSLVHRLKKPEAMTNRGVVADTMAVISYVIYSFM